MIKKEGSNTVIEAVHFPEKINAELLTDCN